MKAESDQRRFPRVHFRRDYGASDRITKAHVHWRNMELSDVFDLSVGGLAVSKPSMVELKQDDVVDFTLELGAAAGVSVMAKVIWVRDFSVGLSFLHLEAQGHLALRKFLNDKLVGSHLRLMSKDLYMKDLDFDFWYSAPGETHVFLKMVESSELPRKMERAEVVIDGDRLFFEGGKIVQGLPLKEQLIQILTHAPEDQVPLQTFLEQILEGS